MREILFRGKTFGGEWEYGVPVFCGANNELAFMKQMHSYDHQVIPATVGQFTGLTDKNGKQIWEGDILRIVSTDYVGFNEIGKVEFKDGCFGVSYFPSWERKYSFGDWHFHRIGHITKWTDHGASGEMKYTYEVIGNIHDNPELMEVTA